MFGFLPKEYSQTGKCLIRDACILRCFFYIYIWYVTTCTVSLRIPETLVSFGGVKSNLYRRTHVNTLTNLKQQQVPPKSKDSARFKRVINLFFISERERKKVQLRKSKKTSHTLRRSTSAAFWERSPNWQKWFHCRWG